MHILSNVLDFLLLNCTWYATSIYIFDFWRWFQYHYLGRTCKI